MTAADPQQVAAVFIATFAARDDTYTRWSGKQWVRIREELTPARIVQAFTERVPLSAYTVGADNLTHVAAIDVDFEDEGATAMRIARTMMAHGAPAFVEKSRRGAHVWLCLDERVPAIVARRALRSFIQLAGIEYDPKIELRPGSDRLSEDDGVGFALRMPTMPHPATGKRYPLCDPESGAPIGASLGEMLLALEYVPAGVMGAIAEQWTPPMLRPEELDHYDRPPRSHSPGPKESASDILRDLWHVMNARPGKAVKCPAHDDQHPSLSITRDDERAICHSPTCDLNNNGRGRGTWELRKMAPAAAVAAGA